MTGSTLSVSVIGSGEAMSKKTRDKLEDAIIDLGRQGGLVGMTVQVLVLGSVGVFYAVGSLGMQTGRLLHKLFVKKQPEEK